MPTNLVGDQVRKLRSALGMSQREFAAKLGVKGWDVSRGTLAKIEAKVRCVSDVELLSLAEALNVRLDELYPASARRRLRK